MILTPLIPTQGGESARPLFLKVRLKPTSICLHMHSPLGESYHRVLPCRSPLPNLLMEFYHRVRLCPPIRLFNNSILPGLTFNATLFTRI